MVEGKQKRLRRLEGRVAGRACQRLAEALCPFSQDFDENLSLALDERCFQGLGEPRPGIGSEDETVQQHQQFGQILSPGIDSRTFHDLFSSLDPGKAPALELHQKS